MIPLAKYPQPAAVALLRQATALAPKRNKASDGLLPSAAHVGQNPNSDHNSGFAVDLTHDPKNGIDCAEIYKYLKSDKRVKYLIFNGRIWTARLNQSKPYTGSNRHEKHLHVSIKENCGDDTYDWFPWMGGPKKWNKLKSQFIPVKKKKKDPTSPKED
jgi:hypothetical protein